MPDRFAATLSLTLRPCREEDLRALEWMGLFTNQRAIIAETFAAQQRGEAIMLLAIANRFPLAQAWLDFAHRGSRRRPYLWAVRVFPPLQSAGIGSWLIGAAEEIAQSRGAREIELGVEHRNPDARRLYERLGYQAVGSAREAVRYSFEGAALAMTIHQEIMRKTLPRRGDRPPAPCAP